MRPRWRQRADGRGWRRRRSTAARRISALAGELTARGWTAAESLADAVVSALRSSRHAWRRRARARDRRLRARAATPLPNLFEIHPDARRARAVELGLRSIPLELIVGTAVGGPDQRGSDFLPLRRFRSRNWSGRWARIRAAVDRLEVLPPIDVVRFADRYWVVDGHNRTAAALYAGQAEIDAAVTELVVPGATVSEPPASVGPMLIGARAVRAAGEGRWTRTAGHEASDEEEVALDRLAGGGSGDAPSAGR